MNTMDLTGRALKGIERYRTSTWHTRNAGSCRFEETCSHYAERALRRHSLPMAVLLVTWRVLRCNPLTATWRDRRRSFAVLALAGLTTAMVSWTAAAVAAPAAPTLPRFGGSTTAGGCSAKVGGQDIGNLDNESHALQVYKGQRIVLNGVAPDGATAHNGVTTAKIYFIENLLSTDVNDPSSGTTFHESVNVDSYLKYGSGVYRIDARSSAPGGWDCTATFYVDLNGDKLAAEAALAVGGVGVIGVVASTSGGEPDGTDLDSAIRRIYQEVREDDAAEEAEEAARVEKDRVASLAADSGWGCLVTVLGALLALSHGYLAAVPPARVDPHRVWVKGHTTWGFIAGFFAGLGALVAGWQFGYVTLTKTNIFFPLAVAVLSAVRARRGRAWKVS